MSLENGHAVDTGSPPPSSGKDSAHPQRPLRRTHEDEARKSDKSYRRYASGIERALASFDSGRLEWPDYISFLGRLLKAIQAHPPAVDELPHKETVANRLAQCLNPSLPSGVHQKAIEVYAYIFSLIGKSSLANDLPVYLPGLSPTLSFASLTLRPAFLALIETYVLPLDGRALRAPLRALILCLLPGLEEENSEEFERAIRILDGLRDSIAASTADDGSDDQAPGDSAFWHCLFLACISSPAKRQGALAYLAKRLPKFNRNSQIDDSSAPSALQELYPDARVIVSARPDLLIGCLAAGLHDEQALVQRGFLDLLLSHLSLDSVVLKRIVDDTELDVLIAAATGVVARRDMSLNRRLWSWFLGPDSGNGPVDGLTDQQAVLPLSPPIEPRESPYFLDNGLAPLTRTLLAMFSADPVRVSERARPFRLCLSLMDRSEIGNNVIPRVFQAAMENLFRYKQSAPAENFQEVFKSASSFFDGIESGLIWAQLVDIASLVSKDRSEEEGRLASIQVAAFVTESFNIREEEMLTIHIPLFLIFVAETLKEQHHYSFAKLDIALLSLVDKLIQNLPERSHLNDTFGQKQQETEQLVSGSECRAKIRSFYEQFHGNLLLSPPPLSSLSAAVHLLTAMRSILMRELNTAVSSEKLTLCLKILPTLLHRLPEVPVSTNRPLIQSSITFLRKISEDHSLVGNSDFVVLTGIASLIKQMRQPIQLVDEYLILVRQLIVRFWSFLDPNRPKFHVEATRYLWQLNVLSGDEQILEAVITQNLLLSREVQDAEDSQIVEARRFTTFWYHTVQPLKPQLQRIQSNLPRSASATAEAQDTQDRSSILHRPLLLLLDHLRGDNQRMRFLVQAWLDSLRDVAGILQLLLAAISEAQHPPTSDKELLHSSELQLYAKHYDQSADCLFYFQHIYRILSISPERMVKTLSQDGSLTSVAEVEIPASSLLESLASTCLSVFDENTFGSQKALRHTALAILQYIVRYTTNLAVGERTVETAVVQDLMRNIGKRQTDETLDGAILDTVLVALRPSQMLQLPGDPYSAHRRTLSAEGVNSKVANASTASLGETLQGSTQAQEPPQEILKSLQHGVSISSSVFLLEHWVKFLENVLPLYESSLYQNIIPLVECFCNELRGGLKTIDEAFRGSEDVTKVLPEAGFASLLDGLDFMLGLSHNKMLADEDRRAAAKAPEASQRLFGNVVSSITPADAHKNRSAANVRLTVILCFHDVFRLCYSIWCWSNLGQKAGQLEAACSASFNYLAQRLRNKSRKMLDRMFAAEDMEMLEVLTALWAEPSLEHNDFGAHDPIRLLQVLESSKPKVVTSCIFTAITSRTNSSAVDTNKRSTLSASISEQELAQFLVEYTASLDADTMDEIWSDCLSFVKDVVANPLPHSQILASLLSFLATLAEKIENTNFGEQRKMKRELNDLFLRLLSAVFATRSTSSLMLEETTADKAGTSAQDRGSKSRKAPLGLLETLADVIPRLHSVLLDNDRIVTAASSISTSVINPCIHSKSFPQSLHGGVLELLLRMSKITATSKVWRKDISEAFNHAKFFSTDTGLARSKWLPILKQWSLSDKDRIPELCSRITPPTSAGIVFGVGASAARLDADKKTQLNLRRITLLLLAANDDFAVGNLESLEDKIKDLLQATPSSSPSSATRGEVFMVLRVLLLKTATAHLSWLWSLAVPEITRAIRSAIPGSPEASTYNTHAISQACRLLDVLLLIAPDEFQMQDWLFVTDVLENHGASAPAHLGLADGIAQEILVESRASSSRLSALALPADPSDAGGQYKPPLLANVPLDPEMSREDFVNERLFPFVARLSNHAHRNTHDLRHPDTDACRRDLLADIFHDSPPVG